MCHRGRVEHRLRSVEINGVAHVALTASNWDRCRPLYETLLPFLGLKCVFSGENSIYYVGGRTAVGVGRCDHEHAEERFMQGGVGLHHICFRCRSCDDVDRVYNFLTEQDVTIIRKPQVGPWAPGYYSFLFEDPAGIRIEFNHVPGRGLLAEGAVFDPAADYR